MAPDTAVEVHHWSKPIGDIFDIFEIVLAGLEYRKLRRSQAREGVTSTGGATPHTRILGCRRLWWHVRLHRERRTPNERQHERQRKHKLFHGHSSCIESVAGQMAE